jgi:hypothetical protein
LEDVLWIRIVGAKGASSDNKRIHRREGSWEDAAGKEGTMVLYYKKWHCEERKIGEAHY